MIYIIYMYMGFPGGSEGKVSAHNAGDPGSIPGSGRSPGEGNGNPLQYVFIYIHTHTHTYIYKMGFPYGSAGKASVCNVRDLGWIPGLGRSRGEGKGYPLQYSGLENSMDYIVHGVTKCQTQLSNFHMYIISKQAGKNLKKQLK